MAWRGGIATVTREVENRQVLYYMHTTLNTHTHTHPCSQKEIKRGDIIPDRRGSHSPPPLPLAMTRNVTTLTPTSLRLSITHILDRKPPTRSHIHMRTSTSPADIPTLSQLYHDHLKSATAKASKYAFKKHLNDRISIWRGDITKLEVRHSPSSFSLFLI